MNLCVAVGANEIALVQLSLHLCQRLELEGLPLRIFLRRVSMMKVHGAGAPIVTALRALPALVSDGLFPTEPVALCRTQSVALLAPRVASAPELLPDELFWIFFSAVTALAGELPWSRSAVNGGLDAESPKPTANRCWGHGAYVSFQGRSDFSLR